MKIVWTRKNIRMLLGVIMSVSFVSLAFTFNFLLEVGMRLGSVYMAVLVFFLFSYLYYPGVLLIVVCYVLLTRVFKYQA